MKITLPSAFALASVHLVNTASGEHKKLVRLICPDRLKPDWRYYLPHIHHDEVVRRALQSAGVAQAMCQAALPMEWTPGRAQTDQPCRQATAEAPGSRTSDKPD